MAYLNLDSVKEDLIPLSEVRNRLSVTEGLSEVEFSSDGQSNLKFNFPTGWQEKLADEASDLSITGATVSIDGVERPLSKGAALDVTSDIGLSKAYVLKTPGELIQPQVDYWYSHRDKNHKMLLSKQTALALTRGSVVPYSSLELLDTVEEALISYYGSSISVMADYKFYHDLHQTQVRLIVPEKLRDISSARSLEKGSDPWSLGLELRNSITGSTPLEIRGYLFAYTCTNGMTSEHASSGKYRRKPTLSADDAYLWASNVVDDVLGGLEHELDSVQDLTSISLEGELNATVGSLCEKFKVPEALRGDIINNLVESTDLSAYGLLAAITQAANNEEMDAKAVSTLLEIGGKFMHAVSSDMCPHCHRL